MSRIVVLGGSGEMGAAATALLRDRGHDTLAASRGTAWFSLAEAFLHQIRLASVAVVPGMRLRPRGGTSPASGPEGHPPADADGGAALGLLPHGDVEVDARRFSDWLAEG